MRPAIKPSERIKDRAKIRMKREALDLQLRFFESMNRPHPPFPGVSAKTWCTIFVCVLAVLTVAVLLGY